MLGYRFVGVLFYIPSYVYITAIEIHKVIISALHQFACKNSIVSLVYFRY